MTDGNFNLGNVQADWSYKIKSLFIIIVYLFGMCTNELYLF